MRAGLLLAVAACASPNVDLVSDLEAEQRAVAACILGLDDPLLQRLPARHELLDHQLAAYHRRARVLAVAPAFLALPRARQRFVLTHESVHVLLDAARLWLPLEFEEGLADAVALEADPAQRTWLEGLGSPFAAFRAQIERSGGARRFTARCWPRRRRPE